MLGQNFKEMFGERKIFIFGASVGGRHACQFLTEQNLFDQVVGYCDHSKCKQGTQFCNRTVFSPDEVSEYTKIGGTGGYAFIISSVFYEEVYKELMEELTEIDKYKFYVLLFYNPCNLKKPVKYGCSDKLSLNMIYDSNDSYTVQLLSLITNKGFLNGYGFGRIEDYTGFGGVEDYFYDSISSKVKEDSLALLDVGAYTGDSIIQIKSVFKEKISSIYAFEPSRENGRLLEKALPEVNLYSFALGEMNGEYKFANAGPFFSMSESEEGTDVTVCRLDSLDLDIKEKIILKIDIEGSEVGMLKGAEQFIKKYRPYIAVCVYHKEKDILDIPQLLKSFIQEYHFYLRGGLHTVCYAFPED